MSTSTTEPMAQLEIRRGADDEIEVGGLRIVACRREVGGIDGGITVYVWQADDARAGARETSPHGRAPELLRLDLFRERPHYHAPGENLRETAIDCETGASVDWAIEALTRRARALVREAEFGDLADELDEAALAAAAPAIRTLFEGLAEPNEVSYFEVPQSTLDQLAGGGAASH